MIDQLWGGVELHFFIADALVGIRDGAAPGGELRHLGTGDTERGASPPVALDSAS